MADLLRIYFFYSFPPARCISRGISSRPNPPSFEMPDDVIIRNPPFAPSRRPSRIPKINGALRPLIVSDLFSLHIICLSHFDLRLLHSPLPRLVHIKGGREMATPILAFTSKYKAPKGEDSHGPAPNRARNLCSFDQCRSIFHF